MGVITDWFEYLDPTFEVPDSTFELRFVRTGRGAMLHRSDRRCKRARSARTVHDVVVDADQVDIDSVCSTCFTKMPLQFAKWALEHHPVGDLTLVVALLTLRSRVLDPSTSNGDVESAAVRAAAASPMLEKLEAGPDDEFCRRLAAAARAEVDRVAGFSVSDEFRPVASLARTLVASNDDAAELREGTWALSSDPAASSWHRSDAKRLTGYISHFYTGDLDVACTAAVREVVKGELARTAPADWLRRYPYKALASFLDVDWEVPPHRQLEARFSLTSDPLVDVLVAHDAPLVARWVRDRFAAVSASDRVVALASGSVLHVDQVRKLLMWPTADVEWCELAGVAGAARSAAMLLSGPGALIDLLMRFTSEEVNKTLRRDLHVSTVSQPACEFDELADTLSALRAALSGDVESWLTAAVQLCTER